VVQSDGGRPRHTPAPAVGVASRRSCRHPVEAGHPSDGPSLTSPPPSRPARGARRGTWVWARRAAPRCSARCWRRPGRGGGLAPGIRRQLHRGRSPGSSVAGRGRPLPPRRRLNPGLAGAAPPSTSPVGEICRAWLWHGLARASCGLPPSWEDTVPTLTSGRSGVLALRRTRACGARQHAGYVPGQTAGPASWPSSCRSWGGVRGLGERNSEPVHVLRRTPVVGVSSRVEVSASWPVSLPSGR
jgi:hypothetical protein